MVDQLPKTVEEKIPSPREMIINNNETTEIFDEDLSETTDDIGMYQMSFMFH